MVVAKDTFEDFDVPIFLVLAGLALGLAINSLSFASSFVTAVPEPYKVSYEGYVIYAVLHPETMYSSLETEPYTVMMYPPIYPVLAHVFTKITGSVFVATRLISSLSAVAVTIVLSLVVREETGGRVLSVGAVPVAFFALNEIARRTAFQANVDMLGLLFGTAALYWYLSRSGRRRLVGVIVLCFLALYTKHSLIAFPGAIFIAYLWEGEYRTAALFAGILSGVGFGVLLVLNLLTDGLFWFHVVAANSEIPYRLSDLVMKNYEQVFKPNMPIIAAGTAAVLVGYRHLPKVLVAYLPLSALTLLALGREGANANFFLVPLIGLVLATGILFSVAGGSERFRAILRRERTSNTERSSSSPSC
jgi:hypothetical protein